MPVTIHIHTTEGDVAMPNATGVVRIREAQWLRLTELAVNTTVKLGYPINQSDILHALLDEVLADYSGKEILEIFKKQIDEKLKASG